MLYLVVFSTMTFLCSAFHLIKHTAEEQDDTVRLAEVSQEYARTLARIALNPTHPDYPEAIRDLVLFIGQKPAVIPDLVMHTDSLYSDISVSGDQHLVKRGLDLSTSILDAIWNGIAHEPPSQTRPQPPEKIGLEGVSPASIDDPNLRAEYEMYLTQLSEYNRSISFWFSARHHANQTSRSLMIRVRRLAAVSDAESIEAFISHTASVTHWTTDDIRRDLRLAPQDN